MAKKQTKKAVAVEEPVVAVKEQPKKKDSWEKKIEYIKKKEAKFL